MQATDIEMSRGYDDTKRYYMCTHGSWVMEESELYEELKQYFDEGHVYEMQRQFEKEDPDFTNYEVFFKYMRDFDFVEVELHCEWVEA